MGGGCRVLFGWSKSCSKKETLLTYDMAWSSPEENLILVSLEKEVMKHRMECCSFYVSNSIWKGCWNVALFMLVIPYERDVIVQGSYGLESQGKKYLLQKGSWNLRESPRKSGNLNILHKKPVKVRWKNSSGKWGFWRHICFSKLFSVKRVIGCVFFNVSLSCLL